MRSTSRPITCSFCVYFGAPNLPDPEVCPRCGNPTIREASEWELFLGMPLTLEGEMDLRNRLEQKLKIEVRRPKGTDGPESD